MSSRALRRLREEKGEVRVVVDDDDDDDDDDGDDEIGGTRGFLSILEEDESSSSSSDDDDKNDKATFIPTSVAAALGSKQSKAGKGRGSKKVINKKSAADNDASNKTDEEEEDFDTLLFNLQVVDNAHLRHTGASTTGLPSSDSGSSSNTLRTLLLSKENGFDIQDLDLDYASRSLFNIGGGDNDNNILGVAAAAVGGGNAIMGAEPPRQRRGGGGAGGRQRRGNNYTLTRKFIFGKARNEWGKPPSYVGGGVGMKEVIQENTMNKKTGGDITTTTTTTHFSRDNDWTIPWPYNTTSTAAADIDDDNIVDKDRNDNGDTITTTPLAVTTNHQRWFTFHMSDTYQEYNNIYQDLLATQQQHQQHHQQQQQQDTTTMGLHDPNILAMFVTEYPYFIETLLQLALVLYYINDRNRGHDILRRCLYLYESVMPVSVLPPGSSSISSSSSNGTGTTAQILIDINHNRLNYGYFETLFRIMQTSGMSGWYDTALATGRYLVSLDPSRDPMGVLLILDYYALASRRRRSAINTTTKEVDVGATFIVDLVESNHIIIHHTDPLTDRHHTCQLSDMPNWAFSYALALFHLYEDSVRNDDDDDDDTWEKSHADANDALVQALSRFPMVLPKLLVAMEIVDQNGIGQYSFRSGSNSMDWSTVLPYFNVENNECAMRETGYHLMDIFVKRCYRLWKETDIIQWVYDCAERVCREYLSTTNTAQPPCISPALARYSQTDPSEYEDGFRHFPPETIGLNPQVLAPAMSAVEPRGSRRFFRRDQQPQNQLDTADMAILRHLLPENELLDPDSPLLQLYLQSLLPWAQVEGVQPPR